MASTVSACLDLYRIAERWRVTHLRFMVFDSVGRTSKMRTANNRKGAKVRQRAPSRGSSVLKDWHIENEGASYGGNLGLVHNLLTGKVMITEPGLCNLSASLLLVLIASACGSEPTPSNNGADNNEQERKKAATEISAFGSFSLSLLSVEKTDDQADYFSQDDLVSILDQPIAATISLEGGDVLMAMSGPWAHGFVRKMDRLGEQLVFVDEAESGPLGPEAGAHLLGSSCGTLDDDYNFEDLYVGIKRVALVSTGSDNELVISNMVTIEGQLIVGCEGFFEARFVAQYELAQDRKAAEVRSRYAAAQAVPTGLLADELPLAPRRPILIEWSEAIEELLVTGSYQESAQLHLQQDALGGILSASILNLGGWRAGQDLSLSWSDRAGNVGDHSFPVGSLVDVPEANSLAGGLTGGSAMLQDGKIHLPFDELSRQAYPEATFLLEQEQTFQHVILEFMLADDTPSADSTLWNMGLSIFDEEGQLIPSTRDVQTDADNPQRATLSLLLERSTTSATVVVTRSAFPFPYPGMWVDITAIGIE